MSSLISVILPTYNREELLPRAVDSVLSQDYQPLELIVIDDGSEDETASVVASIPDPRIRYLRLEKNRGIGFARNKGVGEARGDLIGFIDSDDTWLPGKLARQIDLFYKYPQVDLIFGDFLNVNHIEDSVDTGFNQNKRGLALLQKESLEAGFWQILSGFPEAILEQYFIALPTVMFRAKVIEDIGNFDPSLSGPEDLEFWWRAALHDVRFAYVEQLFLERHKDVESVTSSALRIVPRYLNALDKCEQTAWDLGQDHLNAFLDKARLRAWTSMIKAYALKGDCGNAIDSLRKSTTYGVSLRAMLYTLAACTGAVQARRWAMSLQRFSRVLKSQ